MMKNQEQKRASTYDIEALREELCEQIYRVAATERGIRALDALEAALEAEDAKGVSPEEEQRRAQAQERAFLRIRRTLRRNTFKRRALKTITYGGKALVACCLVASLASLAFTAAVAIDRGTRVRMMELLTKMETQYTEISLQEDTDRSFDVPTGWEGNFYPSKLPEGFEVVDLFNGGANMTADFASTHDATASISFAECRENGASNLDTEGAELSAELVNGAPAILAKKEQRVSVAWAAENRYFILICEGLSDVDALAIARSVVGINYN
jgi:hypothetical protein